jgi:Zn-dependent membrane protease YugP
MISGLDGFGLYLLFALPALLLGLWAQMRVHGSFRKYSQVQGGLRLTGANVARRILDANGLQDVAVEQSAGVLSDHYDPRAKVLRLSPQVYQDTSLAAAGVAAHEAGHALQDKLGYLPLQVRSAMVPSVQVGSWLGPIIFFAGFLMAGAIGQTLAWLGLTLFAVTAAFALVTLPVELDASRRAKQLLTAEGIVFPQEMRGVNAVLNAAALTYVAATVQAFSTLLYYALLLLGNDSE